MQVSAYQVARTFGVEALESFWSVGNALEIQQTREEYAQLQKKVVVLKSFNDGNNSYDILFNVESFDCWRNDHGGLGLAMQDCLEEKVAALNERDRIAALFGREGGNLLRFIAAFK